MAYTTFDPHRWGGTANERVVDEYGDVHYVTGTSGAEKDAKRYRDMAQQPGQEGPAIARGAQGQSRAAEGDAAGLMREAATGSSPSAAERLVGQQTHDTVEGVNSTAAGVRGGAMARAAASRNAQRVGAAVTSTGAQQARAVRAGEMATARGQYQDAATAQRGEDLGLAQSQAELEAQQRAANAQHEQYYERLGWETKNADMSARLGRTAAANSAANSGRAQGLKEDQQSWDNTKDFAGAAAGGVSGGLAGYARSEQSTPSGGGIIRENPYDTSDERAKNVIPYGSLAPMMGKDTMRSDARAKREAYELGRADTIAQVKADPSHAVDIEEEKRGWRESLYRIDPDRSPEDVAGEAAKNMAEDRRLKEQKRAELEKRARAYAAAQRTEQEKQAAPAPAPEAPPSVEQPGFFASALDGARSFLQGGTARSSMRSDMASKKLRTIDLDEPEAIDLDRPTGTAMRDGASEPRVRSFDQTFHRDTPADQKRVKRGVEDHAGKEADEMLASFKARSKEGPAVDAKRDTHVPDAAMFAAMKSMEPSIYAYKDKFRPPEQAPGELQTGPIANKMKKNPIAKMAIVEEPDTKLLAIDKDKALKLTMGSLAVLANDMEKMKRKKAGRA